jgi:ribonuclease HI
MAKFYLYANGEPETNGFAGWALILTNHKNRELSHYMGAIPKGDSNTATLKAVTQALDLCKEHASTHDFTLNIQNQDVYTAINEGRVDELKGVTEGDIALLQNLVWKCPHVKIEYRKGDLEAEKLVREMAKNSHKFAAFGGYGNKERSKVTVTEMRGN